MRPLYSKRALSPGSDLDFPILTLYADTMPRSPRLSAKYLYHHIFARGNNKQQIFFEDDTYCRFLTNLERFRILHGFKLYAYSLLPNHFHLLLQTGMTPLSKTMQVIMTAYSMYINKKNKYIGHLFQGRFGSIIVEKETYFLQVLRYIHVNSVKAGLASTPEEYPWSSYRQYVSDIQENVPQLEIPEVLAMFSPEQSRQQTLFRDFTRAGITESFDPTKAQVRGVLGNLSFHQHLNKVLRRGRL